MSIIFGIHSRDGRAIGQKEIAELAEATARFAPDGTSHLVSGSIGIGFQPYHTHERSRLNSMPLSDDRGNIIAFDGRLDNYRDLCGLLGIRADESSDPLIVLKAFERWGEDCISQLVGDWSLSLWNADTHGLYLARDHAGTRTLYFEQTGDQILWSTYLETFFVWNKTRPLDDEFAAAYLACAPLGELTPYKGVRAVPPAHFLKFERDRMLCVAHWSPLFREKILYRADADYERHFFALFRQAVARRSCPSDPVITQLSGGMDSTAIVSMSDHIRKEVGCAPAGLIDTISYYDDSEPNWNEKPYFTAVEKRRGKEGTHIAASLLEREMEPPDPGYLMPGGDGSTLAAELRLEECLGQGRYRAVISGIGGDELLGGPINPVPELADYLMRGQLDRLRDQGFQWCLSEKLPLVRLLSNIASEVSALYRLGQSNVVLPPWCTPQMHAVLRELDPTERASVCILPSSLQTVIMWTTLLETQPHRFPGSRIRYEYRYPFLDRDLVQFLLCVPPQQIRRPGNRRSLMRRALGTIIAPEVIARKRKALPSRGLPLFISDHRDEISNLFLQSKLCAMGYVDPIQINAVLVRSEGGVEWGRYLARLIALELWFSIGPLSIETNMADPSNVRLKKTHSRVNFERKFNAT